ncbi:MAG: YkgJ family cysteine cluster protein [Candidatus ainarchaeum sp.]|nr:YkgJ family cysteine cluster protein [Candidatus ainarchaeum sp.]
MDNPCEYCNSKCCKYYTVALTREDILRVLKIKKGFEWIQVIEANGIETQFSHGFFIFDQGKMKECFLALNRKRSEKCIFLENNKCSIYEYRPMACRLYPFELGVKGVEYKKKHRCPIGWNIDDIKKDFLENNEIAKKEIEEHEKKVREWNSKINEKKTIKEFIEFLIEE